MPSKFIDAFKEGSESGRKRREDEEARKADAAAALKRAEDQRTYWINSVFHYLAGEFSREMESTGLKFEISQKDYKDVLNGNATKFVVECRNGNGEPLNPPLWLTVEVETSNYVRATVSGSDQRLNVPIKEADEHRMTELFSLLAHLAGDRAG